MKVFKFGGASVKNASSVKNVGAILRLFPAEQIAVVVSAMDKTTNALEKVTDAHSRKSGDAHALLQEVKVFHEQIMEELFPDKNNPVYGQVNNFFVEADWVLEEEPREYDFVYDQ